MTLARRDLSHKKAEKDAENKESTQSTEVAKKESTPFEPLKFKLGAFGGVYASLIELLIEF